MSFWFTVLRQLGRNIRQTWSSQFMTLLTVALSVLIFSLFYLIYTNMLAAGDQLGNELRLVVYLTEDPIPEMQEQLRRKITAFEDVEEIKFITSEEAYERFANQLGDNRDVLADLPNDFLPPSVEVTPKKNLRSLSQIKLFSEYLTKLPGAMKVQYGQDWMERFYQFTHLLSIIVLMSATLLILTTIYMVSNTIRLTIVTREDELELLRLVGATNNYIRTPYLLEGLLQGIIGSALGLGSLFFLYQWVIERFSGPGLFNLVDFTFFPSEIIMFIVCISIFLCIAGSHISIRKYMKI